VVPASGLDAEVRYVSAEGEDVSTSLYEFAGDRVLHGRPVRRMPSLVGQRHYPGLFWSATTGGHIGYESLLELDRLWLADFDPQVEWLASQPLWLSGMDGSTRRRHVPDLLLKLLGGGFVLVDVKPEKFAAGRAEQCEVDHWKEPGRRRGKTPEVGPADSHPFGFEPLPEPDLPGERDGAGVVSVRRVSTASCDEAEPEGGPPDVASLLPLVRRVVLARVGGHPAADDLVQETLVRVLAALPRIEPGMLEPYAIVTARNVIATMWRDTDRRVRNLHRVVDLRPPEEPDGPVLAGEEQSAVLEALARLSERERETLLAHEVSGQDTRALAARTGSTAGAVAAQLNRTRARLRVEYLLALENAGPPTEQCRPVLLALSSGARRRQREVDAAGHLLTCDLCARLSEPLLARGQKREDVVRIPVSADSDIVRARQAAREVATQLGFSGTDLTILATAVSEVARNIVRFTDGGEISVELVEQGGRRGVQIVARDTGPGIDDVDQAMRDGYSTYAGLGLGLPGARRLMDEFAVVSETGRGTTVTMTTWCKEGRQ